MYPLYSTSSSSSSVKYIVQYKIHINIVNQVNCFTTRHICKSSQLSWYEKEVRNFGNMVHLLPVSCCPTENWHTCASIHTLKETVWCLEIWFQSRLKFPPFPSLLWSRLFTYWRISVLEMFVIRNLLEILSCIQLTMADQNDISKMILIDRYYSMKIINNSYRYSTWSLVSISSILLLLLSRWYLRN
jgi:hypothetical protein